MNPERHFSSPYGRVLTVVAALVALAVLVAVAADGGLHALLHVGALPVLAALTVWTLYWRPEVVVSDGGVSVVNPARTVHVPWPAFQGVDTRWNLAVATNAGTVTAWSAPRSSGTARRMPRRGAVRGGGTEDDRPTGASAETVAVEITGRYTALVAAGHLEGAADLAEEHGIRPTTRWHVATLAAFGTLVALAALGLALG